MKFLKVNRHLLSAMASGDLSPRETLLLALIEGQQTFNETGTCHASNRWLSIKLGCKVDTISQMVGGLIRRNWLVVTKHDLGGRRHLKIKIKKVIKIG